MTNRITSVNACGANQLSPRVAPFTKHAAAFLFALSTVTAAGFSTQAAALTDIETSASSLSSDLSLDSPDIEPGLLSAAAGLALTDPLPGAEITSGFGWRIHPILKRRRFHQGVDFGAPRGTPILAAADGVVEEIERHGHYGLYLRIRHNDRVETAYAHMASFAPDLKKGDHVERGQFIATVGTSGWATGPHLYYEVIVDGSRVNPTGHLVQTGLHLGEEESLQQQASADDLVDTRTSSDVGHRKHHEASKSHSKAHKKSAHSSKHTHS